MKNKKTPFFQSKQWKRIMPMLYGIGAALVILGALFKLQHWPNAGLWLSIGMFTEFFIFMVSAFDPPAKEYEWERAYPELAEEGLAIGGGERPVTKSGTISGHLQIDPAISGELNSSMAKFNETVKGLHSLSSVAELSNSLVGGVQQVAGNITNLNTSMSTVNQSMDALKDVYMQVSQAVLAGGKQTGVSLELLNKHLSSVNASYELYIQEHKQYTASCEQMVATMKQSAESSKQVSSEMDKLQAQVSGLNAVYGSMISTVNIALKKR
ncbi:MAG: gliding motility protein GldL [Bacteroidales bacterium]|nr:gliding motility protein GldL [Bacteroidales bacterium]MCL2132934.1 gliding motility protein GldL [Bacteroidales bacterium]